MPKGYALSEATKEGIWELRAQGLSEREIGQLGLGENTVSFYLRALGGIRPRPRRRAERCFRPPQSARRSRAGSPADSRRVRSQALVAPTRRSPVRSTARAGGIATAPTPPTARPGCGPAGRGRESSSSAPSSEGLSKGGGDDHSPEQIAGWLVLLTPTMRRCRSPTRPSTARSTSRGEERLSASSPATWRRGRSRRYARSQSSCVGQGKLTDMVMISSARPRSKTEPSRATGRAIC